MCGIIGYFGLSETHSYSENLLNDIGHRGPDSSGYRIIDTLFLGHTRLSILDLSPKGNQPMETADGNLIIIFNGEIYNHFQIRAELEQNGIKFCSNSDTETLLYGYQIYREKILDKLNGIFAFAIYDKSLDEIFIARDQFGVKPLYYYQKDDFFIFGSEIKPFLDIPIVEREVDEFGLVNYLCFLWSPGKITGMKNVKRLLPGHFIRTRIKNINIEQTRYYKIPFNGSYSKYPEKVLIKKLDLLLNEVVERQMLSDVPVGFFLSGGLDSSLLVSIARKIFPKRAIQTFTIDDKGFGKNEGFENDLKYAKIVAEELKVDLEVVQADINILKDFDKMIWHLGEPLADAAPLNVLNISKKAKEMGYKVLIGGTAGDDLFTGYRRHKALYYYNMISKLPLPIKRGIRVLTSLLSSNIPVGRRIKKFFKYIDNSGPEMRAELFSWIDLPTIQTLFSSDFRSLIVNYDPIGFIPDLLREIPFEKNPLNQMLYVEMNSFLPDHNLNYTDKLSMAVGVEVRVPYLDRELVEFSTSIPPSLKMKGNEVKYILKRVAENYLPHSVIYRSKTGFGAPIRKWVREDFKEKIDSIFSLDKLVNQGIFNPESIKSMIAENYSGKIDASYTIWCLLAFQSWYDQYILHS